MTECAICHKQDAKLCTQCKSVAYCSQKCQWGDWNTHEVLCGWIKEGFHDFARPSPDHVRAVLFKVDGGCPELIWLKTTASAEGPDCHAEVKKLVGAGTPNKSAKGMSMSAATTHRYARGGVRDGRHVAFWHDGDFATNGSRPNNPVAIAIENDRPDCMVPAWRGTVVATAHKWVVRKTVEDTNDDDDDSEYDCYGAKKFDNEMIIEEGGEPVPDLLEEDEYHGVGEDEPVPVLTDLDLGDYVKAVKYLVRTS